MRLGIVSDIHANLEALEVVLSRLIEEEVDEIVCLGDVIGYNASPVECFDTIDEMGIISLIGNHERMLMGRSTQGVKEEKLDVIRWTRDRLGPDRLATIETMPEQKIHRDFLLVHGSPQDPDEYILTPQSVKSNLKFFADQHLTSGVCFFGHTHLPMVIGNGKIETEFKETRSVKLERFKTYLINPGSVGQPRDRCPLCSFGIFDTKTWTMTVIRAEYDVLAASQKVYDAGLDPRLGQRLLAGV